MSLIYLLSTLPMLRLDAAAPITPEAFLGSCRAQLSAEDAEAAEALLTGKDSGHPAVRRWRNREAILRNAVCRERARAAGKDASRWLHPTSDCDVRLEHLAEAALQEKDPLAKERALDKARWTAAEEMGGPDPLGISRVFAYAVELALITRWQAKNAEDGRAAFKALTEVPITL